MYSGDAASFPTPKSTFEGDGVAVGDASWEASRTDAPAVVLTEISAWSVLIDVLEGSRVEKVRSSAGMTLALAPAAGLVAARSLIACTPVVGGERAPSLPLGPPASLLDLASLKAPKLLAPDL